MEIMDPFAYELLSQPLPPGFDPFSGSGGGYEAMDMEQLDNYFRAIGVLPPLPPANAHVQPAPPASSYDDDGAAALATYDSDDDDIGASLRDMETDTRQRPSPGCTAPLARAALVQWMHDFARHFGVGQDALHRAVSYADRFLSASAAVTGADIRNDYQLRLLGAAAVYAASKYEDSRDTAQRMMNARDIAVCCGFASSREVLDAERALLAALGYRLGGPTAHTFVEHFTRRHVGQEVRRRAHALADSSLFDHRCVKLLPSAVAAAAVLLARLCLEPAHSHDREQVRRWSKELEGLTGYKPMDVYDGLDCMYDMLPDDPGFDLSPLLFADPIPS
ncbi:unnamed protein product [Miscanthus lutarioriparius]|uniref:Cyclin N-terminal domain-containing protein n=1 Tax=Miscanthus lutarioriparius TaxID=422564 RepID=A0A811PFA6_9POAL|nr:unnamed protein product [Miscanthus lutarioriparius]